MILVATATLLLLLSCASTANLLTIQAGTRAREMALRLSIGAGRGRLIQMMLVESLLLGAAAATAGMLCAWWSAPFVVSRLNPPDNPVRLHLDMDLRVALLGVLLALGVTILFGLLPALRASGVNPGIALKEGALAIAPGKAARWLVGAQTAFCVLVCFVAGLLVHSLKKLDQQELGFSSPRLLLLETFVKGNPPPQTMWTDLRNRVGALPGVQSTALSGWPIQAGNSNVVTIAMDGGETSGLRPYSLPVGPGWFATMNIPLVAGRDFTAADSPEAVIVTQQFARLHLPGRNPLGETFLVGSLRAKIIGVAGDIRMRELREAVRPVIFHPHAQMRWGTVAIRLSPGASHAALARPLRQLVSDGFPGLRIDAIRLQDDLINEQTIRERLLAALASFFGFVALLLAGLGLYGALSHTVSGRSREMAIRMAVGADGRTVALRVLRENALPVLLGSAAGLACGGAAQMAIRSTLFDTLALEPSVLASVVGVFLVSAAVAAWIPLRRALRIDPVRALRAE